MNSLYCADMRMNKSIFLAALCCILSGCMTSGSGESKSLKDRLMFWQKSEEISIIPESTIIGIEDEALNTYISGVIDNGYSGLEQGDDVEYVSEAVRLDVEKAMYAKGYYEADVERDGDEFKITQGPLTRIGSLKITPKIYTDHLDILGVKPNDPLDANTVFAAQNNLYLALQKENCAFDLDVNHRVFLNQKTNKADIIFDITQGPPAKFGALTFSGQDKVKEKYLKKLSQWEEGVCFSQSKVQALRDKILGTGLFSRADPVLPVDSANAKIIPVEIVVEENKQRTVRAGLSYYTDDGVGAILGWRHRNFFGGGEKLDAELKVSTLEQTLGATLNKPFFIREDQTLTFNTALSREDNDAYEQFGLTVGAGIKRKASNNFSWQTGTNFELTRITEEGEPADTFGLVKPYASLNYDSRDDQLDAHKGWLITAKAEPTFDLFGESNPYIKNEALAQTYYEVHKRVVLASRLKLGSILGSTTENLPATERFYSGGGGSVRGFGFQEIGPFESGDPIGGRSIVEFANEARFKVTETLGGVVFVDVGQVDDNIFPSFDQVALGAGAGVRYYSGIGPMRFDIGVPLAGDDNTDAQYQVYMSIGQAF